MLRRNQSGHYCIEITSGCRSETRCVWSPLHSFRSVESKEGRGPKLKHSIWVIYFERNYCLEAIRLLIE
ncbi:hypothetical protein SUGI_0286440 [Cryptomeria japonica]|nr:hypothetical protein SUGI_0286440 [Cryptomeria japonica]